MPCNFRENVQSATPAELDAAGLFPIPGETQEAFRNRLNQLCRELEALQESGSELQPLLESAPPVSDELRKQAARLTRENFRFRADWVPARYSSRQTGFFSAGILLEVDHLLPLLFLHGAFVHHSRHMGYDAAETMAHELIHAVRTPFPASAYEEYFSCRVHRSAFRRLAGNLFRKWYLPLLFFGGIAAAPILAAAELPGWQAPLLLPLLVIVREIFLRRRLRLAAAALHRAGLEPFPVLLRLSDREIAETAELTPEEIREREATSFRWRLFRERFFLPEA